MRQVCQLSLPVVLTFSFVFYVQESLSAVIGYSVKREFVVENMKQAR